MEIRFCSVCNESIPDGEFDAGRAVVSGKKSQHVACALRRSVEMSGMRSWLTFGLALLGASVAVYVLLARMGDEGKQPNIAEVPAVVEERIAAVNLTTEERLQASQVGSRNALSKQLAGEFEGKLKKVLESTVRDALDKQDQRLRDTSKQVHDRLTSHDARIVKVQQQMAQLLDWKAEIEKEADRLKRELVALSKREAPPPATEKPAAKPAEEPDAPDVEREKEIDRWIKRLRDSDEDIVFSATIELARLKALRATPDLVSVLNKHKDFYARLGAATALGEIQAVDSVPDLITALNDKDDLVRTAASEALHRITGQDFNFVSGLNKSERIRIQKKWRSWWRENERKVRQKLNQTAGK